MRGGVQVLRQVLGGTTLLMMKYGDSPMAAKMPPESRNNIMHARLKVGDMK